MAKKKTINKDKLSELIFKETSPIRSKWADYADERLVPKYNVCRFDDRGDNRFYYFIHEGELVIASGVTEPFGAVSTEREAINKWKEKYPNWRHLMNVSSDYGTIEHQVFGEISLGMKVNKKLLESMSKIARDNDKSSEMPLRDVLAYLKFQEDCKPKTLLSEAQIAWQDPNSGEWLAMTIDNLSEREITETTKEMKEDGVWQRGEKKGQPKFIEVKTETKRKIIALIDYKSNFFEKDKKSFYEAHTLQLIAGGLAVEQNFGIKVDAYYNFSPNNWRKEPSYTLYEHKITDWDMGLWWDYWRLIIRKGYNKPSGGFLITEGFKNSSDYKILSYKEYVEQVILKQ